MVTARVLLTLILGLTSWTIAQEPASFMQRDTDGNGRLTPVESRLSPDEFLRCDESDNGELSLGEFTDFWVQAAPPPDLRDAQYGEDPQQSLDLYLPEDPIGEIPLVLWLHGGSWQRGSKRGCPFQTLTSKGYAVASLDYRLAPQHKFPAQLDDGAIAVTWIKRTANERGFSIGEVSAVGLSAGGHLSLLLCNAGTVDKAISFGAPVNLTDKRAWPAFRDTLEALVGAPLEEKIDLLRQASPSVTVGPDSGDYYLIHGIEDRTIPYDQALLMSAAAAGADRRVQMLLVPDGSHTIVGGPAGWTALLDFLTPNR